MKTISGLACIIMLLSAPNLFADHGDHRHILILHSYHSTFPWTQSINQALTDTLEKFEGELHVAVEYMDTKHFPLSVVKDNLTESYEIKYAGQKLDILIVSDNNALTFALEYRTTLFKDVPIIFSGINNFSPGMLGTEKDITGVAEGVDMADCLALISRIQPGVRELIVVSDNTVTGQRNLDLFRKEMVQFKDRFKTQELIGLTDEEIIPVINKLPSSSAIFYLSFFQDRLGKVRSMKENIEILAENSSVPVYVLWDWAIPFGATGGVVTSGRAQGASAGEMALNVLKGIPVSKIPVLEKSPTEMVINHPRATQYDLDLKLIPGQALLFDAPDSFYSKHKTFINFIIIVVFILLLALITLLIMIRRERRASSILEQQKVLLDDILNNIPHYIFWKDQNFVYQGANEAFAKLLGFSSSVELVGKRDKDLLLNEEHLNFYEKFDKQVVETSAPILEIEEPLLIDGGEEKTLLVSKVPLLDAKETVTGLLGIALDITERKKMESQFRQALKMESVGRLAGGVAHDFNNMLSIILGNSEMVLEEVSPTAPFVPKIKEVIKAAEHSSALTRQLLAFARKQTVSPEVLNLNKVIDGMLKMLKRLIGENITLSWNPRQDLWVVKMDPSQIDQILVNLCVNARDAISDIGKITIETGNVQFDKEYCCIHPGFKAGSYVVISVSDNGCGMDKELMDHLFEPFYTTKALGQGTGLGLATVYGIVKQNSGFINVYSELNKGTTFRIYLPKKYQEERHTANKSTSGKAYSGHETILLVEDEKSILTMIKIMLEKMGYTVLAAATPGEAIQKVAALNIENLHLLMTDVVMPEMNGRELAEKISKLYPNVKHLFMSGYTANVIAHHGILDEGLNFINKPFSRQDLSVKLRMILDESLNRER